MRVAVRITMPVTLAAAVITATAAACSLIAISATSAEAAEYKTIDFDAMDQNVIKTGKYYLKFSVKKHALYVSKHKSRGYVNTHMANSYSVTLLSNGKYLYGMKGSKLYRYRLSTHSRKRLTTVSHRKWKSSYHEVGYRVTLKRGNLVYVTESNYDRWRNYTHRINVKTGKDTVVVNNCDIIAHRANYAVGADRLTTDITPRKLTLYKVGKKGLKKVKTLTKYGNHAVFGKNRLYFDSYPNYKMRKMVIYRCKANGSSKKKVFSDKGYQGGTIFVSHLTSDYCIYEKYQNGGRVNYMYLYRAHIKMVLS